MARRVVVGSCLAALACAAGLAAAGCVDVEGGDRGTYGSPCGTSFRALLLCGRESGGADPRGSTGGGGPAGGGGAATCADACNVVASCVSELDVAECIAECEGGVPQSLIDCIVANGCNYPQACLGGN